MAKDKNKTQAAKPTGFDQKPQDYFRGSHGFNKPFGQTNPVRGKGFIGMRRGSR